MLYNTEAIVVKSINYGETHAIVNLLTPTGLVAALARGAKKPQSRLAASVQLCAQGIFSLYQKSGMGTVQQVELTDSRRALREDLILAAYAAYFCELVMSVSPNRPDGSEGIYHSFEAILNRLVARPKEADLSCLLWESKALEWMGACPRWDVCARCKKSQDPLVAYSPSDGGLVCQACLPARIHHSLVIPPSLPRVLENLRRIPVARVGSIRLSTDVKKAARRVLRAQMAEYGGIRMRSQKFLETLESGDLFGELFPEDQ